MLGREQSFRCHYRPSGSLIQTWRAKIYRTRPGEHALVAEDGHGLPVGYLLWEEFLDPETSPRPAVGRPHLFLHSAYVEPGRRGQGVFTALSRSLLRRYPGYPVIGLPTHDAVGRFFNRVERMRGRSSDPYFYPYRGSNGRALPD